MVRLAGFNDFVSMWSVGLSSPLRNGAPSKTGKCVSSSPNSCAVPEENSSSSGLVTHRFNNRVNDATNWRDSQTQGDISSFCPQT